MKIQGGDKCGSTIKRIAHHIGVKESDPGRKQREGLCSCNSDKKSGIMGQGGGWLLREEGIKRELFFLSSLPFSKKELTAYTLKHQTGDPNAEGMTSVWFCTFAGAERKLRHLHLSQLEPLQR